VWHEPCSSEFPCPAARWVAKAQASNPFCERRAGVQAGNLVRVGNLVTRKTDPRTGDTPRTSCNGLVAVKVVGGGNAKAFPRCEEREPGGGEAHEGRGSAGALTGSFDTALSAGSKALKSRAISLARVTPQAVTLNGKRA
jgi:hypothetical protein